MKNRKPNRLPEYNYSENGWYYVTICTNKHIHYFGEVSNGKMILNQLGVTVKNAWEWLAENFQYIVLDEFIVMPNHFHGIIIIDSSRLNVGTSKLNVGTARVYPTLRDLTVGTSRDLSLPQKTKIKTLSELIGAFKTKSSKYIYLVDHHHFKWQRSFYDRIIRDENELYYIREYIQQNPLKWEIDKNIENLEI